MEFQRSFPTESTSLHQSHSSSKKKCCYGNSDGFTIISVCFFVVTATITFALMVQIYYGNPEVMPHGAVATDDRTCSEIGMLTMRNGGNAVDVTISSLMCLSVTHPHVVGAGGGGVMLVYDHKKNFSIIFDFMSSFPSKSQQTDDIGVPGFLRGLETIHRKFGLLKWKDLILPAVNLAKTGFIVSNQLAQNIARVEAKEIRKALNRKGSSIVEGITLKRPIYAEFLEDVAHHGADAFYQLKYGVEFLEALRVPPSFWHLYDLENYKVLERPAMTASFYNMTISLAGLPFAGGQVVAGLHALQNWGIDHKTQTNSLYDAIIKALQLGYVWLQKAVEYHTNSTSVNVNVPELPAAQVVAVDAFDLYVSAVVGLGSSFGSKIITKHQIILNDQLSTLPFNDGQSSRPLMPFCPVIVTNSKNICGNRLSLSSGSSSAALQVLTQFIMMGHDMTTSIAQPRIALGKDSHTILVNDLDSSLIRVSGEVRQHLKDQNYTIGLLYTPLSVNGIQKYKDKIVSHSDTRGGGVAARLDGLHVQETNTKIIASSVPSNIATYDVPKDLTAVAEEKHF